jgi:quercetin dioxygenase-like cupin family protein
MPQNKEQQLSVKPAKVMKLADIVSYQEGAVVSREIVSKNTGTVTVFAFDAGQGLSEHTAPFDALVYLIDGEAEVTIAGKPLRLASGDMVVMPANKPHALKAVTRFKMVLTMIRA